MTDLSEPRHLIGKEIPLSEYALRRPRPVTAERLKLLVEGERLLIWQRVRERMQKRDEPIGDR